MRKRCGRDQKARVAESARENDELDRAATAAAIQAALMCLPSGGTTNQRGGESQAPRADLTCSTAVGPALESKKMA